MKARAAVLALLILSAVNPSSTVQAVPRPSLLPYAVQTVDPTNHTFPAPPQNVWYPGASLTVRPGIWRLSYRTTVWAARCKSDPGTVDAFVALSTDPTKPSDLELVSVVGRDGGNTYRLMQTVYAEKVVALAAPTTFTLILSQSSEACWDALEFQNTVSPTVIRAERLQ